MSDTGKNNEEKPIDAELVNDSEKAKDQPQASQEKVESVEVEIDIPAEEIDVPVKEKTSESMSDGKEDAPAEDIFSESEKADNTSSVDWNEVKDKTVEVSKTALHDLLEALKLLISDPINGLKDVTSSLGKKQLLGAGATLIITYVLTSLFSIIRLTGSANFKLGAGNYFKLILASVLAPVVISGLLFGLRKVFKKSSKWEDLPFLSGTVLLPLSALMLITTIIGMVPYLLTILSVFALTNSILLLYASIVKVIELEEKHSLWAVPTCLVLFCILYQPIIESITQSIFKSMMGNLFQ